MADGDVTVCVELLVNVCDVVTSVVGLVAWDSAVNTEAYKLLDTTAAAVQMVVARASCKQYRSVCIGVARASEQ